MLDTESSLSRIESGALSGIWNLCDGEASTEFVEAVSFLKCHRGQIILFVGRL